MIRIMKMTIAIVACFIVGAYAGMIEVNDDDQHQYLEFSNCDSNSVGSIILCVRINPDSGYWQQSYALGDTIFTVDFGHIRSDIDEYGNRIPGDYFGEYWFRLW